MAKVKTLDQEKIRKKKEKERIKERKRRLQRINARIDRTVYLLAILICAAYVWQEMKDNRCVESV